MSLTTSAPASPRKRLLENPPHWTTVLALIVLLAIIAMALFAPQLAHFEPTMGTAIQIKGLSRPLLNFSERRLFDSA